MNNDSFLPTPQSSSRVLDTMRSISCGKKKSQPLVAVGLDGQIVDLPKEDKLPHNWVLVEKYAI